MLRVPSHLQRHPESGIFYFRLAIPARLRHIVGRREIKKSLRTGAKAEALVISQKHYFYATMILSEAERALKKKKSPDNIEWTAEALKKNAAWSMGATTDPITEEVSDDHPQVIDSLPDSPAPDGSFSGLHPRPESLLLMKIISHHWVYRSSPNEVAQG